MKIRHSILIFALLLPAASTSCDTGIENKTSSSSSWFRLEDHHALSNNYPGTKCWKIATKSSDNAGVLCRSRNGDFLSDNGVDRDSSPMTVSTATSVYEMKEKMFRGKLVQLADVDCDDQDGAIYRPTSTCTVAYWQAEKEDFVYMNMTLTNHASQAEVLSREEVDLLIIEALRIL